MSKPEEDRIPHKMGHDGIPRPYSQQELAVRRAAVLSSNQYDQDYVERYQEEIYSERLQNSRSAKETEELKLAYKSGQMIEPIDK